MGIVLNFQHVEDDHCWSCRMRGGKKSIPLRFLNMLDEISDVELLQAIDPFCKVSSPMVRDVFDESHGPGLLGLTNGNRRLNVVLIALIPDVIRVRTRQIRILHVIEKSDPKDVSVRVMGTVPSLEHSDVSFGNQIRELVVVVGPNSEAGVDGGENGKEQSDLDFVMASKEKNDDPVRLLRKIINSKIRVPTIHTVTTRGRSPASFRGNALVTEESMEKN